ncbi:MAG: ATP-binding protein [Bacteroidales bacterium]|nr:ATP-binding protein [Bacteroidales bacterium]
METYSRQCPLRVEEGESIFLFGARQTGKTTLLRERYPEATYIDLLDTELLRRFSKKPSLLYEMLKDAGEGEEGREGEEGEEGGEGREGREGGKNIIIIDEVQQAPILMNEVHRLITEKGLTFILCGSSARKLRRNGYNTLGGRAIPCRLYPLVSAEVGEIDLQKAVTQGMLPRHYLAKNATPMLSAYVEVYLREEVRAEALVRNVADFQRFLEVAAMTDGEMVNYTNIAAECGVSANTVKEYFTILEDTLIGFMLPAFTKTMKRKVTQAPKFYYFDVGIVNYLLHRKELHRGTAEYGHAFEHFIVQEMVAYVGYQGEGHRLSYWHTYTGQEVDIVVDDASIAIEIKSAEEIEPRHTKGLKAFKEEHSEARLIIVSLDRIGRKIGEVENVYATDFLKRLWEGRYF